MKWRKLATKQFIQAIEYIEKDSLKNAIKVESDIKKTIHKLLKHPEFYPPDKYKKSNDSSYRAFELNSYRVSYRIKTNEIVVLRMRHTSMEPKMY